MRIGRIGLLAAMVSVPAMAVAQTSFTPLPPVPAMQPLYPVNASTRVIEQRPRPVAYVAAPAPAPIPYRVASVIRPSIAVAKPVLAPAPLALSALDPAPVFAARTDPVRLETAMLPANTPIILRLDEEVNSDGRKVGDVFRLTVQQDVVVGGVTAIPRGAPAFGKVSWRTGNGAFGKSGKITIDMDRVEVAGRIIPLTGQFREEGRGNTALTIGLAVGAGLVAAAFVRGKDAAFHAGRELLATTRDALALDLPDGLPRVTPSETRTVIVAR